MKFINSVFLAISILLPMKSYSQETPLTLEDLTPGGKTFSKYRAEMPRQLGWYGDKLTYIKGDSVIVAPNTDKEKPQVLLSLQDINSGMGLNNDEALKSLNTIQFISPQSNDILIATPDKIYLYDFVTKKMMAAFLSLDGIDNHEWSEKSKMLAYTKDNNLYIQDSEGKETAITNETDPGIVSGQSVHRNEFGINKGIFWSPAGNLLAFYRMDETMVTDYPLVDVSARIAKLKNIKYPMAGMKSHHVTVGVYNPATQQTVYLKTGTPKEKYLTNIAWSPDEKSIYIAEVNRGQDTCIVRSYDAVSGKLQTTLFTETHPKYVEPENPVLFLKNEPSKFLWQSERDGFNHLYLYDTTGKLLKQITSGKWDVTSVLGFDEKGENLFYVSTEVSPIEKHIYKLNLKTGKREQLSKEEGVHDGILSASGKFICDKYTSQNNPGKVTITETKSNKSYIWYSAKNPYRNIQLPEITLGKLKANDNVTDLYYRLVKPLNFDPNKKYPVIVYVYGGPHSQMVDNSWMGQVRGWDIYMAEKGYVVFTMDNRGTSNRGIDFENITHRRLGVVETDDQMTGVEYLKSLGYVDVDRIGVHGWSYGGFMTLNLMLRHPETFKVGVAGGPVTDWKYYEVMYGERYMDSPQENQEGYKNSSMVERAGDLKGRLMLIHGDEDPTVVMQQSLQFLHSAIKKGTHPDFFIYPGHGHNMTGRDRVHLHGHITRYFEDFLK
ncbi:S9 family peptidase [uncultured Dysgonomonas sp.]|uniref:Prolyl tripeptidyl peptidase n=1 Tax=uncultured Dysgonomonas sp. TaxID=206096 RepID=A0A212JL94_9BACT|nr:S9 family peptidase [uncultured Dysgonomonas sp.]SBW00214.1 Prolyl tripeptidyl peptidase [uncultured Dysgonomonas sp.]